MNVEMEKALFHGEFCMRFRQVWLKMCLTSRETGPIAHIRVAIDGQWHGSLDRFDSLKRQASQVEYFHILHTHVETLI